MVTQLTERRRKLNDQLNKLDNQPKLQAEKKGQITEGLRISEKEKDENEEIINSTDEKIENLRSQLNEIQEQSIQIRERKASSGATIEGLKKRKSDLVDRINSELNLSEENILENSRIEECKSIFIMNPDNNEQYRTELDSDIEVAKSFAKIIQSKYWKKNPVKIIMEMFNEEIGNRFIENHFDLIKNADQQPICISTKKMREQLIGQSFVTPDSVDVFESFQIHLQSLELQNSGL